MKRVVSQALFVFLALFGIATLGAQATELRYDHRVVGDRSLTIQLGPLFPLGFQSYSGNMAATNLTLGGSMGVDLDFYLDDTLRLGAGLKGMVSSGPNDYTLFLVPITFRATWEFKLLPFSFPVGAGAGFTFVSYQQRSSFDPIIMPTAGAYWNMSSGWSFGFDVAPWLIFQTYFPGGTVPSSDSRIAYFLDITAGAIYHF